LDEGGFVHGEEVGEGVAAHERRIPWLVREKGLKTLL
jgi:hypothetical protein